MEKREKGLTIIIPCLNEEKTIEYCVTQGLGALAKYKIPGEVLVVDNGSVDRSAEIAEKAGARVIKETEKGYGSAYYSGIRHAKFDHCLKADADGSYDFYEINLFWDKLQEGKWDIILGSRFKGKIMPGAMPFSHKYFGTPALTMLINLIYKSKLSDINSGMRAYRTQTMLDLNLKCKGMEFASEMLVKALKKGLKILEVPITLHKDRREGRPHLRSFRDGWRHLRFIMLMSPLQLFFYPGMISIILGILLSGLFLLKDILAESHPITLGPIFGITTFACLQNLIILGEALVVFAYIAKLRLIQASIDVPNMFIEKLRKTMTLDRLLLGSIVGIGLTIIGSGSIGWNLYLNYINGYFTPFYTKLGIFNFTVFIYFAMMFFASFFISGIEIE
ncbi:MAG: glycosyltransferase family 2 protein [bacterium]